MEALNRKAAADDLSAERIKIKDGANEHGTLTGLADRTALDFSVVMSKCDTGVIEWRREDDEQVIAEYEKALAEELPEQVRLMLERQLEQVRTRSANWKARSASSGNLVRSSLGWPLDKSLPTGVFPASVHSNR